MCYTRKFIKKAGGLVKDHFYNVVVSVKPVPLVLEKIKEYTNNHLKLCLVLGWVDQKEYIIK